jgi:hypothetical protein
MPVADAAGVREGQFSDKKLQNRRNSDNFEVRGVGIFGAETPVPVMERASITPSSQQQG